MLIFFEVNRMCNLLRIFLNLYLTVIVSLLFTVEFLWSHTTESMCVGYMSAQDSKPRVRSSHIRTPSSEAVHSLRSC